MIGMVGRGGGGLVSLARQELATHRSRLMAKTAGGPRILRSYGYPTPDDHQVPCFPAESPPRGDQPTSVK